MNTLPLSAQTLSSAEVYTDLHGLQSIKGEQDDAALKKIAQQFESMFVSMMLKNMRNANAVFESDSLFQSQESQFYRDLLDQQQALTLSHGQGLGIADALYRQMSARYISGEKQTLPPETLPPQTLTSSLRKSTREVPLQSADSLPTFVARQNTSMPRVEGDGRVALATSPKEFIEKLEPYAREAAKKIGVDKRILLAQSALETGWGQYVLANDSGESSNNLFNIKRGHNWSATTVSQRTVEYHEGVVQQEHAEFRVYSDIAQSFDDYVKFVVESERYQDAVSAPDHVSYINKLHAAGYATDPHYSEKVLSVYERVNQLLREQTRLTMDENRSTDQREGSENSIDDSGFSRYRL